MKCELCAGEEIDAKYGAKACIIGMSFNDPALELYSDDYDVLMDIKYCPMCGRKLDEE